MLTLDKAVEILRLNIAEAESDMPPDVKDALFLAVSAMEAILDYRVGIDHDILAPLPGEEKEPQPTP